MTFEHVVDDMRKRLARGEVVVVDVPDGGVWLIDATSLKRITLRKKHNCAVINGQVIQPCNIYFGEKL